MCPTKSAFHISMVQMEVEHLKNNARPTFPKGHRNPTLGVHTGQIWDIRALK